MGVRNRADIDRGTSRKALLWACCAQTETRLQGVVANPDQTTRLIKVNKSRREAGTGGAEELDCFTQLGIDPTTEIHDTQNKPYTLCTGRPIRSLLD